MRRFIVTGKGNFPFVMLSRDTCYPASEAEAQKIYDACPTVAPEQSICLITLGREPNFKHWRELKWPARLTE